MLAAAITAAATSDLMFIWCLPLAVMRVLAFGRDYTELYLSVMAAGRKGATCD
jgi:hypothetical protein